MQPNTHGHFHHPDPNLGHQPQNASSQSHKETTQNFSDPETPTIPIPHNYPTNMNPTILPHHQTDHATLYFAIFSLNLGNKFVPHTPMNSPTSSPASSPIHPNQNNEPNLVPEEAWHGSQTANQNEESAPNFSLRWTWGDGTCHVLNPIPKF